MVHGPYRWTGIMILLIRRAPRCCSWPLYPRSRRSFQARFLSTTSDDSKVSSTTTDPSQWKGASHSSSVFVTHVVAGDDSPSVLDAIQSVFTDDDEEEGPAQKSTSSSLADSIPLENSDLAPIHLLQLGSVWFLPASAPRDPSLGGKPTRLSDANATQVLNEGDYLRIHHSPRRFPLVYNHSWTEWHPTLPGSENNTDLLGVVLARTDHYWVIDKPANVPVHPTVDNVRENVAESTRRELLEHQNSSDIHGDSERRIYVSTPQRLDQNTSGLFVLARSKDFASYFASLLRTKTGKLLEGSDSDSDSDKTAIKKLYKCLVCMMPMGKEGWSMASAYQELQAMDVMTHYLKPSARAPKHFAREAENETWLECRMRIVNVGDPCPLFSQEKSGLAVDLWMFQECIPDGCVGVVELEVELLTGRTHQIRGQLAADGFPLVGDVQYGGAVPRSNSETGTKPDHHYAHSERLALQCSQLEFLDPDIVEKGDGEVVMTPSNRWNKFRVDENWWTPILREHQHATRGTTSAADLAKASEINTKEGDEETDELDFTREYPEERLLPPRVSLSHGKHKYVLVKATHPLKPDEVLWFVKSASAKECRGPYHVDVAYELVEWLEVLNFEVVVVGGGRIHYDHGRKSVKIYGFSYGFGRADHRLAGSIVTEFTDLSVSYNIHDNAY